MHPYTLLSTLLLSTWATAQEPAPQGPSPVQRVLLLFDGADTDDNRKIVPAEALKAGIKGGDFASYDHDGDRSWDPDEFLVYYHKLLQRAGHTVDPRLDQAVARVTDARDKAAERARVARAEAARAARQLAEAGPEPTPPAEAPVETPAESPEPQAGAPVGAEVADSGQPASEPTGETASLDEKLDGAKEDLQQRAANADGATREQYDAAALALEERARNAAQNPPGSEAPAPQTEAPAPAAVAGISAAGTGEATPQEPGLSEKLAAAKEDLQQRAAGADGATREQYDEAAASLDERARAAAAGQGASASGQTSGEEFDGVPLDAKLAAALRAVETRGRAAGASEEAIAEQKRQLIQRARGAADTPAASAAPADKASVSGAPEPVVINGANAAKAKQPDLKPAGEGAAAAKTSGATPVVEGADQEGDSRVARSRAVLDRMVEKGSMDDAEAKAAMRVLDPSTSSAPLEPSFLRQAMKRAQDRLQAAHAAGDISAQDARQVNEHLMERAQTATAGATPPAETDQENAEDRARAQAAQQARNASEKKAQQHEQAARARKQGAKSAPQERPARPQDGKSNAEKPAREKSDGGRPQDASAKKKTRKGDGGRG